MTGRKHFDPDSGISDDQKKVAHKMSTEEAEEITKKIRAEKHNAHHVKDDSSNLNITNNTPAT